MTFLSCLWNRQVFMPCYRYRPHHIQHQTFVRAFASAAQTQTQHACSSASRQVPPWAQCLWAGRRLSPTCCPVCGRPRWSGGRVIRRQRPAVDRPPTPRLSAAQLSPAQHGSETGSPPRPSPAGPVRPSPVSSRATGRRGGGCGPASVIHPRVRGGFSPLLPGHWVTQISDSALQHQRPASSR